MMNKTHLQCPVCGAAFSGKHLCPGCGADLTQLMEIVARSLNLRRQARQALRQRQYRRACRLSTQAQHLRQTSSGQKLLYTAQLMDAIRIGGRA
jgi:hypothetical protein